MRKLTHLVSPPVMDRKVELVGGTTINFIYTLLNTKSSKLDIFRLYSDIIFTSKTLTLFYC